MIQSFIERARRRYLWNELWAQSAFAGSLLLGCAILLLLAGTQLLDWRLVLAIAMSAVGVGIYRTVKRVPSSYGIAVLVDHRAGLHDSLSTALHFTDHTQSSHALSSIRSFQREQAEKLLPSVNLESTVPFRMPKAIFAMMLLAIVASALFALRYGISRTLNMQTPMTQVVMDGFGLHSTEDKADAKKKSGKPKTTDALEDGTDPLARSDQKRAGEMEAAPGNAMQPITDPDVDNEKAQAAASGEKGKSKGEGLDKGDQKGEEQAENGQPAAGKTGQDNPSGSRDGQQQGEQQAGAQQGSQPNQSSMLSKLKDAMQNLMSKASPQSQAGQKPNAQQGQQKGQSQQSKSGEKGQSGQSKDGGQQESADSQEGQQAGDQDNNSENGQGKGNGKSSDQQAAAQPGSGVGKQDGAKDIKAAEQKAAMGKLTEIMGKRSASVSGEMMVESQSGPQQLRTQYSKRNATHGETGGEVNRDEVPMELQSYVQQYFQEVRKGERSSAATRRSDSKVGTTEPKVK